MPSASGGRDRGRSCPIYRGNAVIRRQLGNRRHGTPSFRHIKGRNNPRRAAVGGVHQGRSLAVVVIGEGLFEPSPPRADAPIGAPATTPANAPYGATSPTSGGRTTDHQRAHGGAKNRYTIRRKMKRPPPPSPRNGRWIKEPPSATTYANGVKYGCHRHFIKTSGRAHARAKTEARGNRSRNKKEPRY